MILNRMNIDNENENMKKQKKNHDIEKDVNEEEEEKEEEEEEEEENEDNHHKKMIKNNNIDSSDDNITSLKSRIFYYKIFSIILAVFIVLIIIIILLSGSKSDNKELTSLASNQTNFNINSPINTNNSEKNNDFVDSKIKDDLMNAYNNNKEINIIKFYEENIIKKSNDSKDLPDTSKSTNIHINIGFNENNINLIIEHLSSILFHSSQTTFLHIHMMDADSFSYESFIKLKNMVYKINNNTEVIVYNCANVETDFKIKEESKDNFSKDYVKLCAFKVLKNIEKIIFLDGDDCMVQKDLAELYNLDMNDIYGRGISEVISLRSPSEWLDKYLYDKSHYINTGVILVNLELCQKGNFYEKAMDLNNNVDFYTKTENPVQDIFNVLMRKKIEFFHPKYNKISFYENPEDKNDESKWYPWVIEALKIGEKNNHFYTKEDLVEADNNPVIIHYAWERQLNKVVKKYEDDKKFYAKLVDI